MAGEPKSYGYPVERDANGNVTNGITSAILASWLVTVAGARFSVMGEDDWKVSVQPGLDRGIRINAGTGVGDSVMDVFPDYDTRSLPAPAGASQYFLIAARRNWTAPASTNFVVIPGNATRALPLTGIKNNPGQESDQPIALVRVLANQTVVQEIVDLRAWAGNGGVEAADILGREQLARPGAAVKIGNDIHRYEYNSANGGSFAWKVYEGPQLVRLELATIQANQAGVQYGPGLAAKMQAGVDAARSSNQGRFTIGPADRITIRESGAYSVSWLLYGLDSSSGALGIYAGDGDAPKHASGGFTAAGEASVSIPDIWLNAGDVLGFYFTANKSVNAGHRIRIRKTG